MDLQSVNTGKKKKKQILEGCFTYCLYALRKGRKDRILTGFCFKGFRKKIRSNLTMLAFWDRERDSGDQ